MIVDRLTFHFLFFPFFCIMADNNISDMRLLLILKGGEALKSFFDPEGLLSGGYVCEYIHGSPKEDGSVFWSAKISFDSGDVLGLGGTFLKKGDSTISNIRYTQSDGKRTNLSIKPQKSLLLALGDLSGLPVSIKRNLSPMGPKKAYPCDSPWKFDDDLFAFEEDALFWGVDGGKKEEELRKGFSITRVSYIPSSDGFPYKADISAIKEVYSGKMTVNCSVDIYGLANKSVVLERKLDSDSVVSCECFLLRDGRKTPSIKVALKLLKKLISPSQPQPSQDKQRVSMGHPKMK